MALKFTRVFADNEVISSGSYSFHRLVKLASTPGLKYSKSADGTYGICEGPDTDVVLTGEVIIADAANGVLITKIDGFHNCVYITGVTVPDSAEALLANSFKNCYKLEKVNIAENSPLKHIGNSVFSGCDKLTNINIPDTLKSIGTYAFYGCESLTNINIPEGVTVISDGVFKDCNNLILDKLPNKITSIGSEAFSGCVGIIMSELPDTVVSIGSNAFLDCTNLALNKLPSSVTSIGDYAFKNCSNITVNEIPAGVTSLENSVFEGCSSITNIEILDGVTRVGCNAFANCTSLKNIVISNSVTEICVCLHGCNNIESITVPSLAFTYSFASDDGAGGTTSLTVTSTTLRMLFAFQYTDGDGYDTQDVPQSLKTVILSKSVETLHDNAFYRCASVENITIPGGLSTIGSSAFSGCTSLKNITFGGTVAEWNAITKDSNWKKNVPTTAQVICTDGTIPI